MSRRWILGMLSAGVGVAVVLANVAWKETIPTAEGKTPADHKYIGVKKCKMCHSSEKKGNQYKHWADSKHAKAYEVLGTPQAKEVGKKAGVDDPQKSEKCLKCHVTAYDLYTTKKDLFGDSFKVEDGVQCESCHGPGSDYNKKEVMQSHDDSVKNGLIIPDGATCRKCHNAESPSFKSFCFKSAFAKIDHPDPEVKRAKKAPECDCAKDDAGKCKEACKDQCNK